MASGKEFVKKHNISLIIAAILLLAGIAFLKVITALTTGGLATSSTKTNTPIDLMYVTLPYAEDSFASGAGWKEIWGIVNPSVSGLQLASSEKTNGAIAVLEGTSTWNDYLHSAIINWNRGSDVTLMARYKDDRDYVSCIFDDQTISIREDLNGTTTNLLTIDNPVQTGLTAVSLGISVNDNTVKCYEGSQTVASSGNLDPSLGGGGVGIGVWDKQVNNAQITAKTESVIPIDLSLDLLKTLPTYPAIIHKVISSPASLAEATSTEAVIPKPVIMVASLALPYFFNIPANMTDAETYILDPNQRNPWQNTYGLSRLDGGVLNLSAGSTTSGASVVLPGGSNWTDYSFNANINWIKATDIELVARYADSKNYVACDFLDQGTHVKIYAHHNGKQDPLDESSNLFSNGFQPIWPYGLIGVEVRGNTVSCLRDNKVVVMTTITNMPPQGSIGFQVYGPMKDAESVNVFSVRVLPI